MASSLLAVGAVLAVITWRRSLAFITGNGGAVEDQDADAAQSSTPALERHPLYKAVTWLPPANNQIYVLAAFPGSGGAWVRQVLELGTGFATGSVAQGSTDSSALIIEVGDECEQCVSANATALVNMQTCMFCSRTGYFRDMDNRPLLVPQRNPGVDVYIVHLLRNPFQVLMDAFLASSLPRDFSTFKAFVTAKVPRWKAHTQHYMRRAHHTVTFESFLRKLRVEIVGILALIQQKRSIGLQPVQAADRALVLLASMSNADMSVVSSDFARYYAMRDGSSTLRARVCSQLVDVWNVDAWGTCNG